jgi:hypothetical protein
MPMPKALLNPPRKAQTFFESTRMQANATRMPWYSKPRLVRNADVVFTPHYTFWRFELEGMMLGKGQLINRRSLPWSGELLEP